MEPTIKDFEAAIAELDAIVKKLEDGDLALEKSLELYERGVQLSRFCHSRLEEAEKRIEIVNERGELKPAPASLRLPDGDERRLMQEIVESHNFTPRESLAMIEVAMEPMHLKNDRF